MSLSREASRTIDALGLVPHPEGGYYRETFRALADVPGAVEGTVRAASTAIYFLLPAGTFSAWHVVASDEVWHHYDGAALALHTVSPEGVHAVVRLGRDVAAGERPQHVVPAGTWQAARPLGEGHALCGCTVAPGFDFADFEMPTREALTRRFPHLAHVIAEFTRG